MAKKTKKKKKSIKKVVDKKSLSPEETKTKLKKLYAELKSNDDQKEKKNIRAKLRTTSIKWKDILGIKNEQSPKKTKKKKTSSKKSVKKTKKKKGTKKAATA